MGKNKKTRTDNVIRFDWAAKYILRNKAHFVILEGLVSAVIGEKITIEELLESESNRQHKDDKCNRVDIKARDSHGEIILIEIQQEEDLHFLSRVLYSTAKAITEHIDIGMDYTEVKKVISINVLYFNLGVGADYLYHGKSELVGVHTGDHLVLGNEKPLKGLQKELMSDVFPEYYVLRVCQYDADREPADALDEWMRYLKVGYINPDTKVPGLKEAMERLNILKMTVAELRAYEDYQFNRRFEENVVKAARFLGEEKGREEGLEAGIAKGKELGLAEGKELGLAEGKELGLAEGKELGFAEGERKAMLAAAKRMLEKGMSRDDIVELTGLTLEAKNDIDFLVDSNDHPRRMN